MPANPPTIMLFSEPCNHGRRWQREDLHALCPGVVMIEGVQVDNSSFVMSGPCNCVCHASKEEARQLLREAVSPAKYAELAREVNKELD